MGTGISSHRTGVGPIGFVLPLRITLGHTNASEVRFARHVKPRLTALTDVTNEPDDEELMVRPVIVLAGGESRAVAHMTVRPGQTHQVESRNGRQEVFTGPVR
jgi:hypothetical protein